MNPTETEIVVKDSLPSLISKQAMKVEESKRRRNRNKDEDRPMVALGVNSLLTLE